MSIRVGKKDVPVILYLTGVGRDHPERAVVVLRKRGFYASLGLMETALGDSREIARLKGFVERTLDGEAQARALELLKRRGE